MSNTLVSFVTATLTALENLSCSTCFRGMSECSNKTKWTDKVSWWIKRMLCFSQELGKKVRDTAKASRRTSLPIRRFRERGRTTIWSLLKALAKLVNKKWLSKTTLSRTAHWKTENRFLPLRARQIIFDPCCFQSFWAKKSRILRSKTCTFISNEGSNPSFEL